ncbi:MAG: hypothetical protein IPN71_07210 [Fibrobacteres bacterium]|nr:hypothetical protein [Fibrobacterota bacterium]
MAESLPMRIMLARKGETDHLQFLSELVEDEMNRRAGRLQKTAIERSKILHENAGRLRLTQSTRPAPPDPGAVLRQFVHENGTCYLSDLPAWETPSVLRPGSSQPSQPDGKRLKNAFDLADDLVRAREANRRRELIAQLVAPQLLILDEFE